MKYILDITWHVSGMPPLVGPFDTRVEADDFARLNVPNGSWEVRPLTDPYGRTRHTNGSGA